MTYTMQKYLKDWLWWATASEKDCGTLRYKLLSTRLVGGVGLCDNPIFWAADPETAEGLKREMDAMLAKEFPGKAFPFNIDTRHYISEASFSICHKNAKRVSWVREKLAEMDTQLAAMQELTDLGQEIQKSAEMHNISVKMQK